MPVVIWLLLASAAKGEAEVAMPLDHATVHRPARLAHRRAFAALPEAVVVVANPSADLAALAKTFARAAAAEAAVLGADSPLSAFATGPVLDGPDKALPRRFARRGHQLDLEILHTAVRLQGARLRRNIRWRPMAQVPLRLPAGRFRLTVTWRAVASLPDGKALETPALVTSVNFEIRAGKRPGAKTRGQAPGTNTSPTR